MRLGLKITLLLSPVFMIALASAANKPAPSGVLLELFTSHGCFSCPAADAVLSRLDEEDQNVVALEFHVDYWDQLVWGMDGSWRDPFSQAVHSERQRFYNGKDLKGRKGVYTPQVVVNGERVEVGSKEKNVRRHIEASQASNVEIRWMQDGDVLIAALSGDIPGDSKLWVARFIKQATTEITGGENAGKVLTNHNIVTHIQPIELRNVAIIQREKEQGKNCALILQEPDQGRVLAASYCPSASTT